jgi:hypothetical protein
MKKLFFPLSFLLASSVQASINIPLTIQEALYPGSVAGISRTSDPFTVGIPLPDNSAGGATDVSQLALAGASVGQFRVLGRWPSGRIKWVLIDTQASLIAGQTNGSIALTSGGSGNFGGPNLATDNGATITVNTGSAIFVIRKAGFNGFDTVTVGGTAIVTSGSSQGLVLTGPAPGQTSCSPCSTVYSSVNDPNSTAVIEENGPAKAVIKATGSHLDASGNTYMHFTVRMYFYVGKNFVKITSILRNADYGASNSFATAYKGLQSYELRVAPSVSGPLNYMIANDTASPTTGSLSGSDGVYLYQGQSQLMTGPVLPVPYTTDTGYSIVKNGGTLVQGGATQYPQGWADISDGSGKGVEIGVYQMAAYWPKSLEFNGGGSDVRIGIWARQNSQAVYLPWPQWSIHDLFLNFHATALSSPANEFLKFQHYLVARADRSVYNSTGVFLYNLIDPAAERNFYNSVISAGNPSITQYYPGFTIADNGLVDTYNYPLRVYRLFLWGNPGGANQMEFHMSYLFNFIRRGFTGSYLDASHFYRLVAEKGFPFLDGDSWRNHPADLDTQAFPNQTSLNAGLGFRDWADEEHKHWYGMPDYYFMTGDETVRDGILAGPKDRFASTNPGINPNRGGEWNSRALGSEFMGASRLSSFLSATSDPDAAAVLAQGQNAYNLQVKPDLCVSGFPTGCSVGGTGVDGSWTSKGTSRVRGAHYAFQEGGQICGSTSYYRVETAFQASIMLEGIWELRLVSGPNWPEYNNSMDLAYGISNWALTEDFADDGTGSWQTSGFRYYLGLDVPNACDPTNYQASPRETVWFPFFIQQAYKGTSTDWTRKFNIALQKDAANGAVDEFGHYTVAALIDRMLQPGNLTLVGIPINVTNNGGGSYTLSWTVPSSAQSYVIKTGPKQIVDWIGFDAGTNQFTGDPVNTMAWFAASTIANPPLPAAAGTTQQFTVTGLNPTGQYFALKAFTGSLPPGPTVSFTAPANGASVSGTVNISANASSAQAMSGVQFEVDGSPLGSILTGAGPSYSSSWNTAGFSNGSHTLAAVATDTAGGTAIATISLTVSNGGAAAPVISNVISGSITASSVTITWTTDQNSDSQVAYGLTTSYGATTPIDSTQVTSHSVTLTGLTAGATYHYQALSRNSSGNVSSSADFTFTTPQQSGGASISLTTGTWTQVLTHGFPVQAVGWEKLVYANAAKKSIMQSDYHEMGSEPNRGLMAYDFAANRWDILESGDLGHTANMSEGGHPVGAFDYNTAASVITSYCCGSGSSGVEVPFHTWWYDPIGQVGRDKMPPSKPGSYQEATASFARATGKLVFSSAGWIYDPSANAWSQSSPAKVVQGGGVFPAYFDGIAMASSAYDSSNGMIYLFGGRLNYGPGETFLNDLYAYDPTANSWTLLKPSGTPPAPRQKAAWAYDSTNNVFLLFGGHNDSGLSSPAPPFSDTWIYDPVANQWTQVNPPQSPVVTSAPFERMAYDPDDNVFILVVQGNGGYADGNWTAAAAQTWLFRYQGSGPNPGTVTPSYSSSPGGINRNNDGWAQEPALAASGATLYTTWIETGRPFDGSNAAWPHTYTDQFLGSSWSMLGSSYQSVNSEFQSYLEAFWPSATVSSGSLWISYYQANNSQENPSKIYAKQWTGGAWQGAAIGAGGAGCGNPNAKCFQMRSAVTDVGGTPYIAFLETDRSYPLPHPTFVYVKAWNGSSWNLVGTGPLNRGPNVQTAESVLITSDGNNPYVGWTEYPKVSDTQDGVPQVFVSKWDGSQWNPVGGSLNMNAGGGWASEASIAFLSGQPYVAWTERSQSGSSQLYVKTFNGSTWVQVGSGSLNKDTVTGWALHPSLVASGAALYLGWAEQQNLGQHSQAYVSTLSGGVWTSLGGSLNASGAGSAEHMSLVVLNGQPVAAWGEVRYGSTRQVFVKQWNGSSWNLLAGTASPPSTPPPSPPPPSPPPPSPPPPSPPPSAAPPSAARPSSPCDLNGDGVVNSLDVQIAINQALGLAACTTADLERTGACTVTGVQRVINASLGEVCRVGP